MQHFDKNTDYSITFWFKFDNNTMIWQKKNQEKYNESTYIQQEFKNISTTIGQKLITVLQDCIE